MLELHLAFVNQKWQTLILALGIKDKSMSHWQWLMRMIKEIT
ncbi:hypothetical protein A0G_0741 [Streptococcus iniae 9117]|nr:hypothetical protein [Streptococcus iniae]EKB52906.1 hypothetical protein A0G_0741 [Streptococcus iniae 9117]ESR10420.1 hypothetical protein IUSA1_01945 [Streptococcus iniae IUSA1]